MKEILVEAVEASKRYPVGSAFARGGRRYLHALDRVSLAVTQGETLGLVGESGCGKSTLGRAFLRLHDLDSGKIRFEGRDITRLGERELRPIRARMQMVFQDPYSSLNPRRRVGDLVAEPLRVHGHGHGDGRAIEAAVTQLLERVGLRAEHADRFPHEFSGGQRQRVGIARALALRPRLLVADEPVSALDVSVQAQIVNLFADLQEELGLTYVFIAHDLSVVRQMATRVAVMYLGGIVELGPTDTVLHQPAHPYTAALISAIPHLPANAVARRGVDASSRVVLRGDPPSPVSPPPGCRFHTRCPIAKKRCVSEPPILRENDGARAVACHFPLA